MTTPPVRLTALDAFRGATIAGMILVNYAAAFPGMYRPLLHAAWDGFTPADLVFPSFVFIVGVAMWFSFKRQDHALTAAAGRRIARRTLLLLAIGLALNAINLLSGDQALRLPGVIQRLALCYGLGSVLCLALRPRALAATGAALLLGYWGLLLAFGGPEPLSLAGNAVRRVDLAVFGAARLYQAYGVPFDPEGLLSTLPALVNVIAGYLCGRFIDQGLATGRLTAVVRRLGLLGVPCVALAVLWHGWLPINKPLWSSSYVLLTIGLDLLAIAAALWCIDGRGWRRPAAPFVAFGENPLGLYILASAWESALFLVQRPDAAGTPQPLMYWLNDRLFAPWLGTVHGGLALTAVHLALFGAVAWWLHRRRIILRV